MARKRDCIKVAIAGAGICGLALALNLTVSTISDCAVRSLSQLLM
jgi:cation diffusion facilitator CzcD-associated flavoprotein CzcO